MIMCIADSGIKILYYILLTLFRAVRILCPTSSSVISLPSTKPINHYKWTTQYLITSIEMHNLWSVRLAPKHFIYFFFCGKKCLLYSDLVSRVNNLVGYNLPDSYLGIPLSIFTIDNTLGNKNEKLYNQKLCLYYSWSYTIEIFPNLSSLLLLMLICRSIVKVFLRRVNKNLI